MADRTQIAVALLVRDGLALLAHRHPSRRHYPDCWDLVGGHVEPGESPADAVRRECLEELGVVVHDPAPIELTVADPSLDVHGFVVTGWDGEPANTAPDEHDALGWFSAAEVTVLRLAHPESLGMILDATALGR